MSLKYDSHVNVEYVASAQTIIYICKYIHKGHDCATVAVGEFNDHNEIRQYTIYLCLKASFRQ